MRAAALLPWAAPPLGLVCRSRPAALAASGRDPAPPARRWRVAAAAAAANDSATSPPPLIALLRAGARTTAAAHVAWASLVPLGSLCVDATAGLGGDTVELARLAGPGGAVISIDTDAAALEATAAAVDAERRRGVALAPVTAVSGCHSRLDAILAEHGGGRAPALVSFNLGFLPGEANAPRREATATQPATTVAALRAAAVALAPGGAISVASYVGHNGGETEAEAAAAALGALPAGEWTVVEARLLNRPSAPRLTLAWRKG
jgi:SAM-dependent methyltransferase